MNLEVLEKATGIYSDFLLNNPHTFAREAWEYIVNRGISRETIIKFRLGYCPSRLFALTELKEIFSNEQLLSSGIFDAKYGPMRDYLTGRITIPLIYNNKVRYMTSREFPNKTPIPHLHQHGQTEFTINHDAVDAGEHIFLVEGPFDCMTLYQQGIPCVGLLGAHRISKKVIKDIYYKEIYIAFDTDPNQTGKKASMKLARKLAQFGLKSKIVTLPSNGGKMDINDFFKTNSLQAFNKAVSEAQSFDAVVERPNLPQRVEGKYDILEIASKYLEVKRLGSNYKSMCPFHEDSNPSLVFYPNTQTCYCFGCGTFANSVSFIQKMEEVNGNRINRQKAEKIAAEIG